MFSTNGAGTIVSPYANSPWGWKHESSLCLSLFPGDFPNKIIIYLEKNVLFPYWPIASLLFQSPGHLLSP